MKFACLTCFLFLASSCAPQVRIQDAGIATPARFKNSTEASRVFVTEKFWELYSEPELNSLVEKALKQNSDLRAASLRIERDFALAKANFSQLFPSVSANPGLTYQEYSLNTGQPIEQLGIPRRLTLYTLPLDFSYELDLWGRVRGMHRAAKARARATYFQYLETQLTLVAEVCKTYWSLRNAQRRFENAEAIAQGRRRQAEFAEARGKAGLAADRETRPYSIARAEAEADLLAARTEREILKTSLAILLNEHPSTYEMSVSPLPLTPLPSLLPEILPSDWIRRRPDVLAAEQNIVGANALTQSALAEFFPKFTFSARLGLQSLDTSTLLAGGSRFFALGPSASLPLFNWGEVLGNYQARRADAKIALEDYKKTLLKAFKDVEDHLVGFNHSRESYDLVSRILGDRDHLARADAARERAGLLGGGEKIDSEILRRIAEQNASDQKLAALKENIEVLKSLGYGSKGLEGKTKESADAEAEPTRK